MAQNWRIDCKGKPKDRGQGRGGCSSAGAAAMGAQEHPGLATWTLETPGGGQSGDSPSFLSTDPRESLTSSAKEGTAGRGDCRKRNSTLEHRGSEAASWILAPVPVSPSSTLFTSTMFKSSDRTVYLEDLPELPPSCILENKTFLDNGWGHSTHFKPFWEESIHSDSGLSTFSRGTQIKWCCLQPLRFKLVIEKGSMTPVSQTSGE